MPRIFWILPRLKSVDKITARIAADFFRNQGRAAVRAMR
jgi:hypothetical protein